MLLMLLMLFGLCYDRLSLLFHNYLIMQKFWGIICCIIIVTCVTEEPDNILDYAVLRQQIQEYSQFDQIELTKQHIDKVSTNKQSDYQQQTTVLTKDSISLYRVIDDYSIVNQILSIAAQDRFQRKQTHFIHFTKQQVGGASDENNKLQGIVNLNNLLQTIQNDKSYVQQILDLQKADRFAKKQLKLISEQKTQSEVQQNLIFHQYINMPAIIDSQIYTNELYPTEEYDKFAPKKPIYKEILPEEQSEIQPQVQTTTIINQYINIPNTIDSQIYTNELYPTEVQDKFAPKRPVYKQIQPAEQSDINMEFNLAISHIIDQIVYIDFTGQILQSEPKDTAGSVEPPPVVQTNDPDELIALMQYVNFDYTEIVEKDFTQQLFSEKVDSPPQIPEKSNKTQIENQPPPKQITQVKDIQERKQDKQLNGNVFILLLVLLLLALGALALSIVRKLAHRRLLQEAGQKYIQKSESDTIEISESHSSTIQLQSVDRHESIQKQQNPI